MSRTFLPTCQQALATLFPDVSNTDDTRFDAYAEAFHSAHPLNDLFPTYVGSNVTDTYKVDQETILSRIFRHYWYSEIAQYPLDMWTDSLIDAIYSRYDSLMYDLYASYEIWRRTVLGGTIDIDNKDYTDSMTRTGSRVRTLGGEDSNNVSDYQMTNEKETTYNDSKSKTEKQLESDTPKNMTMTKLDDLDYVSNARVNNDTDTTSGSETESNSTSGSMTTKTVYGKTDTETFNSYKDSHRVNGFDGASKIDEYKKVRTFFDDAILKLVESEEISRCFMGVIEYACCY